VSSGKNRCTRRKANDRSRFLAREVGDRMRLVPDAAKISISTINRACGL
jgi:hypothetical protein